MSFLDQAKQAATSAMNTATNLTNQATAAAQPTLQNISASVQPTLQNVAASVQPTLSSVAQSVSSTAAAAATQAQSSLHNVVPSVVPAPAGAATSSSSAGVDRSHDLAPHGQGTEKLEHFLESRPQARELQDKNILKGSPDDALAGKKAELLRAQLHSSLEGQIAARPAAEELVREGILTPGEAPPSK